MGDDSRFRYRRDDEFADNAPPARSARPSAQPASAARSPAGANRSADSLAELARLIGDEDPFAEFSQPQKAPAPAPQEPARSARPASGYGAQAPAPSWRQTDYDDAADYDDAPEEPPAPPARAPAAPPRDYGREAMRSAFSRDPVERAEPDPRAARRAYDDEVYDEPAYQPDPRTAAAARGQEGRFQDPRLQDPRFQDARAIAPRAQDPRAVAYDDEYDAQDDYDDTAYQPPAPAARGQAASQYAAQPAPSSWAQQAADPRSTAVRQGYGSLSRRAGEAEPAAPQGRHAEPAYDDDPLDDASYAYAAADRPGQKTQGRAQQGYDDYDDAYDPDYADDGYMPPHSEEIYETEPRRRKGRMALLMVASVLGLIVAGTAGVFAYRMAVGSIGTSTSATSGAPVIKADSGPSKVQTPSVPAQDGQQKMIYDRVSSSGSGNERVVPREEQPVDVSSAARPVPGGPAPQQPSADPSNAEPKRVRTMVVRPDGSLAPAPAPQPASNSSSLYGTSGAQQVAAATPAAAAAPASSAPPAVSASGVYMVQLGSLRSEAEAQTSWKTLQQRFPSLLGSYRPAVKRADLGDRGIYFRLQVGPFSSRDAANDLCQNLRSQGGDCTVQKT